MEKIVVDLRDVLISFLPHDEISAILETANENQVATILSRLRERYPN